MNTAPKNKRGGWLPVLGVAGAAVGLALFWPGDLALLMDAAFFAGGLLLIAVIFQDEPQKTNE